jgi:ornithine cyclodeaminase/alanine dehydrogenase-like protein (mu-crystallin family)
MRIVAADDIDRALTYPALIDALAAAFRADIDVPVRHHHTVAQPGTPATLLLMPAWTNSRAAERFVGCKMVTVFPDNANAGRPSVYGTYFLMDGASGEPLAVMDGPALTAWRTAAASALAARHLAREDAAHLVMVGAGALAPHLVRGHACVRPIRRVTLWNRTRRRAVALAFGLSVGGVETEVTDDLEGAVREADIVSCATLAREPLIRGAWLKKGVHLDLVGGFTPEMREADDRAVKRARVYVDTRGGACSEAGDIVQPQRSGVIAEKDIRGDLFDLCRGKAKGRTSEAQITLFKSVGTAIEDLAAAILVWRGLT